MSSERRISRLVTGQPTSDGAGVHLNRVIGGPTLQGLDPFLLLDEFGSDDPGAYIAGFPDHPHRGFETVTYMLAGRMRHRDNKGNTGLLGPGSVQWMTAGKGLVHSEMPEQDHGLMQGFQLWINLPASRKLTEPRYQDIPADQVPETERPGGVRVRVIAGDFGDVTGPVDAESTSPLYLDIALPDGQSLVVDVPLGHAGFIYVYEGVLKAGLDADAKTVSRGQLGVTEDGDRITLSAQNGPCRVILVAGRPINEPVARYGPFVMNSEAEIRQAIDDFRNDRF